jgi:hypothetical protein
VVNSCVASIDDSVTVVMTNLGPTIAGGGALYRSK